MHLILTGATGLVGSAVLQHMITQPSITTISVLSRRPVPQAEGHEKVKVIIQTDFTTYPSEILNQLKGAQGCVWAQGISQTQVTKEEYEKITYDYPMAAAEAFSSLTSPFKFVYVSGEGATTIPGRFTPLFGVVKGRAESQLLALAKSHASFKPFSLRAGVVDPTAHTEIHKFIPQRTGMMKAVEKLGLPVMRIYSSIMCPTRDLARVLTDLAMGDGEPLSGKGVVEGSEGRTLNNIGMRILAGL